MVHAEMNKVSYIEEQSCDHEGPVGEEVSMGRINVCLTTVVATGRH